VAAKQAKDDLSVTDMIERVKRAMLAMQRASWEQGVAAQALLELGETELVVLMAKEAIVRQDDQGRLAVVGHDGGVVDPAASGEAVLAAARITGDSQLQEGAERMAAYLLHHAPRTSDGILYHILSGPEIWSDATYMAPPFLAVAGYPAEAVKQINGFRSRLWDPQKKLFSHRWDEAKQAFLRRDFWGVGNGWCAAGMARVIRSLPPSMEREKQQLARYVQEVIDGCVACQRPDGLFHDVVDAPSTFVETNLGQMLAYSIYHGVYEGWLAQSYLPAADRMRAAAHVKVDEFGLVQGVCSSPRFDRPGTATEGQAFFLLMEAAHSLLASMSKSSIEKGEDRA
jgi:unsaturated rhamnogalacturonyl hydrolase